MHCAVKAVYRLEPLPAGTQRSSLVETLQSFGWNAKPLQPCKGSRAKLGKWGQKQSLQSLSSNRRVDARCNVQSWILELWHTQKELRLWVEVSWNHSIHASGNPTHRQVYFQPLLLRLMVQRTLLITIWVFAQPENRECLNQASHWVSLKLIPILLLLPQILEDMNTKNTSWADREIGCLRVPWSPNWMDVQSKITGSFVPR